MKYEEKKKMKLKKKGIVLLVSSICLVFTLFSFGYFYSINTKKQIDTQASNYFKTLKTTKEFGKEKKEIKYSGRSGAVIKYPNIEINEIDQKIKQEALSIENNYFKKYKSSSISLGKMKNYLFLDYDAYYGVDHIISITYKKIIMNDKEKIVEEEVYTQQYSLEEKKEVPDTSIFIDGYKESIEKYLTAYYKEQKDLKENYQDSLKKEENYQYALTETGIKVYLLNKNIHGKEGIEEVLIPYEKLKEDLNVDVDKKEKELKVKQEEKETFKEEGKKIYINHKTNVYEKNDKNSTFLGTLKKGDLVEQIQVGSNKFIKIKYQGKECYILAKAKSEKPVTRQGYKTVNDTIILAKGASIYEIDSEQAKEIIKLDKMKSVSRIGSKGEWNEILYNDGIAFVKSSAIAKKEQGKTLLQIDTNRKIDLNKPMVALTFDDGPNPSSTNRILDTLEKYNAVATFFDLASLVESHPETVRREVKLGCEVGSHTYSHVDLASLSTNGLQKEMNKSTKVFKKVLGHDQVLVRAPYGSVNKLVRENMAYPLIGWDIDTLDWKSRNKNSILNEVRKEKDYDGRIILMHSIYETTADAVEEMVPELINKGYQLVTISELAKYKGYDYLKNGTVYYSFR